MSGGDLLGVKLKLNLRRIYKKQQPAMPAADPSAHPTRLSGELMDRPLAQLVVAFYLQQE